MTPNSKCHRVPANRRRLGLERLEDRTVPAFAAPVAYPTGAGPSHLLAADFNNDSRADLATVNGGTSVSVLLGNADGTFQPAVSTPASLDPYDMAADDFNNDGWLDLVVSPSDWTTNANLLLGNGNGTFQAPIELTDLQLNYWGVQWSVVTSDFNHDGNADLAVYGWYISERLDAQIWLGDGQGHFAQSYTTTLFWAGYWGLDTVDIQLGDFNEDGNSDLVLSVPDAYRTYLLLGNSNGTFNNAVNFVPGYGGYPATLAADLNSDGHLDVAAAHYSGLIDVFFGNGNGSFQAPYPLAVPGGIGSMAAADFNADGLTDLIAGDNNAVNVWLGTGSNCFDPVRSLSYPQFGASLVVGHFNADSAPDVAVINGSASAVSVLINDGDWPPVGQPVPAVSISDASVTEGNSGTTAMNFTVTLSAPSSQLVTVQYNTANGTATAGSDYIATSGTLTFAPGETTKSISVQVLGDVLGEPYETFYVNLQNPVGLVISDGSGAGTIIADDFTLSAHDPAALEGNSGTVAVSWSVTLSAPSTQTITVQFLTADGTATAGSDYQSTGGTLMFLPGETSKAFTLTLIGDRIGEGNETILANLSNATNATIDDSQGVLTILDNERRVSINDVSMTEGNSGTKNFVFTVTLSAPYDQAVTMSYRTVNGTAKTSNNDYFAKSGSQTFEAGETSKTITIQVKGDKKKESNETFQVELYNLSSNALFTDNWGLGTILNDD